VRSTRVDVLAAPFGQYEQLTEFNLERFGELGYPYDRRTALAALDAADVVAVDPGLQAQCLLRKPTISPHGTKRSSKTDENTLRLRHAVATVAARCGKSYSLSVLFLICSVASCSSSRICRRGENPCRAGER